MNPLYLVLSSVATSGEVANYQFPRTGCLRFCHHSLHIHALCSKRPQGRWRFLQGAASLRVKNTDLLYKPCRWIGKEH